MTYASGTVWTIIILLGVGTFLIRFSFLGLVGDRKMPDWVLRHLRYTPVAVLPGLVAPLVFWPAATGGATDAPRLAAASITVLIGWWTKNVIWAVFAGALTLYGLQTLG
ncbi:MAG: AzlD domain-containing protein [Paracoccaceae bacterium]|nr:AzlD domain-containing protein [Paracoccaceae bacterium]